MRKLAFVLTIAIFFAVHAQAFAQFTQPDNPATAPAADSIRERLLERREQARESANEITEETRARVAEQREEFQQRLQTIQDTKKREIVQRIDTRISVLNQTITNSMFNILTKFDSIMERMEARKNQLEEEGVDVAELERGLNDASTAVENARLAVENQAAQEYIIDINNENTLGQDVQETIGQFRQDIRTVRDELMEAKDALQVAAIILNELS